MHFDARRHGRELASEESQRLFLVLEQLVDLDLVHVFDVLQVEPKLLGLFCFLSVHLQDGVVSLLQVLKRGENVQAQDSSVLRAVFTFNIHLSQKGLFTIMLFWQTCMRFI